MKQNKIRKLEEDFLYINQEKDLLLISSIFQSGLEKYQNLIQP